MVKDMDENQDVGGSAFEERIRDLFQDGASWRGVSAISVMHGARRRRVRHRATAAGASFAMLGVAAGAVAFGGHVVGPSRTTGVSGAVTSPAAASSASGKPADPTSTASASPTSVAETCSASVSGPVPPLTRTTVGGLDLETASGTTAGIPWSVQLHYFPDKQAWVDWLGKQISGRELQEVAATRQSTGPSWLVRPLQKLPQGVVSAAPGFFGFGAGNAIGQSSAQPPKAYVSETFLDAKVDHLCLQFAHHAEFVPVYRTGDGGSFAVASYPASDQPRQMIGYDTAGQVVGTKALGEQTGAQ